MPFHFILHHAILPGTTDAWGNANRNCANFLAGTFAYVVVYVILRNLRLRQGELWDAVLHGLFLMWLADCATMAYEYRAYYGRNILNELGDDEDQRRWVFDEASHRYRRPTAAEVEAEAEHARVKADVQRKRADEARKSREVAERTVAIKQRKREIRAARVIQRWWRARLYSPPDGIWYLRSKETFEKSLIKIPPASM